jgi:ATP-dependent Lhr-like helicase
MNQKITKAERIDPEKVAAILHPLVNEWFFSKFPDFSEPQLYGVPAIHGRKNILISAPTGGTKTLTSFLSIINYLVDLADKEELENKVYAVYTSPLKSLSNDIHVNLENPLKEIYELAEKKGKKLQEIRVGLRTGDTTTAERTKMLKKAPHILITTPESLAINLTTKKFVERFHALEFIIIDEIHAMANKRGVHLALTIERMQEFSDITPVRIGLSATVSPLEEVARFLIGDEEECIIADVQFLKKVDIKVLTPAKNLMDEDAGSYYTKMYKLMDDLIQEHKSTIIFTNTRSATERVVHHLKEIFPKKYSGNIGAHHSSLSKESRFTIEEQLRSGKLKVVVSSTSLEMGIDIGTIDLVILLGSPKSVARAMQRIGRAGHKIHETAKGRFIVLDRDDLVECSVMTKAIMEKKIDNVQIPKNCLDILSQQIYAMAISKIWNIDEMLKVIRKSYPYKNLTKADFLSVISYLAGDYSLEERNVYAKIWYDTTTREVGKKGKLARVISITNTGTIPDESFATVVIGTGERKNQQVGKIDEGFLERLKRGDIFVLGGETYMFLFTRGMKAYVSSASGRSPTIPAWFSEMLPLSFDLALAIQKFRGKIKSMLEKKESKASIIKFLQDEVYCDLDAAEQIYNYFNEQHHFSEIPDEKTLVIEEYKGEKRYIIFHTLFGRRVNDVLSRAIAYLVASERGRDVEVGISDNGFYLAGEKMNIEKALNSLNSKNLDSTIKEAIEKTQVLKRRFRHCATRSLMILRNYKGHSKTVGRQQVNSEFLYRAVKKISNDFPILNEARREVLEDLMDIEGAKYVLNHLHDQKIKIVNKKTIVPSPFALNLIIQGYSDLIKMEDRIAFLKRMHEVHKKSII